MSSDNDSVLGTVVNKGVSLEVGLGLELVHSDGLGGALLDSFDVFNLVVG